VNAGDELGPSRWVEIEQARIDAFASATEDGQWIHTSPERAAEGPFGTTVAHGFLTLSLLPALWFEVAGENGYRFTVNYGVNRVRFPAPVPAGSRLRARYRVEDVEAVNGYKQATIAATVEREGQEKPVCVAELVFRFVE
jgi:acyl dehydratase